MAYYFLLCDPTTGRVARRSHSGPLVTEPHLLGFRVPKSVWKRCAAGLVVNPADLSPDDARRWLWARDNARDRAMREAEHFKQLTALQGDVCPS